MPPFSNGPTAADHLNTLTSFANLMARQSEGFEFERPKRIDGERAITLGAWALGLDQSTPPAQQFGIFDQCHPEARCLGCSPFCRAESPALDLSIRASGRPALWIEAYGLNALNGRVSVRTFVPREAKLAGVWIPTLCAVTGRLLLVCTKRGVAAQVLPNGRLLVSADAIPGNMIAMGAWAFRQAWASMNTSFAYPAIDTPSLFSIGTL